MPLDNINDVFANATFDGTNLTLPVADLPKFNTGNDVQEGAELVYALVDKLQSVVSAAGHSSLSAGVENTFASADLTMTRSYTFASVLDLTSSIDNFDVKPDTSFVAIPDLAIAVDDSPLSVTVAGTNPGDTLSAVTFTGDGVAIGDVATYAIAITGGLNNTKFEIVYDAGWQLKVKSGAAALSTETAATYTVTVTTADTDDIDPVPAVTATFTLTVT